jgi:hypothetical protein
METTFDLVDISLIEELIAQINEYPHSGRIIYEITDDGSIKLIIFQHSIGGTLNEISNDQFVRYFSYFLKKFASVYNLKGINYKSYYEDIKNEGRFNYVRRRYTMENFYIGVDCRYYKYHVPILITKIKM